ncbi:hypothetical protein J6590_045106 [Homalodisca vitripennis]|nr:hypothetical protein J6590_045106 [Homalodisca vitripennis]
MFSSNKTAISSLEFSDRNAKIINNMRKSSLGRRSSTHIPVRVPSLGASGQRTCSGGKKSVSQMKQPGFSQRGRSQSEERESYGGRATIGGLVRSNTAGALAPRSLGAMTPITPRQSIHSNLPTGSARVPRHGEKPLNGSVELDHLFLNIIQLPPFFCPSSSYGSTSMACLLSR